MKVRLGELLIEQGVLTEQQVEDILAEQQRTGRPFGLLCEQMFGIDPAVIESSWSQQYARLTRHVDLEVEVFENRALELVTRRQAWQFHLVPVRFDDDEVMIATTVKQLPRALRFANNVIGLPVYFVISESAGLANALGRHYPIAGMNSTTAGEDHLRQLVSQAQQSEHNTA